MRPSLSAVVLALIPAPVLALGLIGVVLAVAMREPTVVIGLTLGWAPYGYIGGGLVGLLLLLRGRRGPVSQWYVMGTAAGLGGAAALFAGLLSLQSGEPAVSPWFVPAAVLVGLIAGFACGFVFWTLLAAVVRRGVPAITRAPVYRDAISAVTVIAVLEIAPATVLLVRGFPYMPSVTGSAFLAGRPSVSTWSEAAAKSQLPGVALLSAGGLCCGYTNGMIIGDEFYNGYTPMTLIGILYLATANILVCGSVLFAAVRSWHITRRRLGRQSLPNTR